MFLFTNVLYLKFLGTPTLLYILRSEYILHLGNVKISNLKKHRNLDFGEFDQHI